MRHSNLFLASIMLLGAGLLVFYGVAVLAPITPADNGKKAADRLTPLTKPKIDFGNPRRGAENPVITIVEYGDYQCAPCAEMDGDLTKILQDFPDKIAVVWKDLPSSSIHPVAEDAAAAARCAGQQGDFWRYHDLLLANQDSLSNDNLPILATEAGLDHQSLSSCLDAGTQIPTIKRDVEEGIRLQITATPTLFIGDRRIEGAVGYDRLRAVVESALAEAAQTVTPTPAPTPTH